MKQPRITGEKTSSASKVNSAVSSVGHSDKSPVNSRGSSTVNLLKRVNSGGGASVSPSTSDTLDEFDKHLMKHATPLKRRKISSTSEDDNLEHRRQDTGSGGGKRVTRADVRITRSSSSQVREVTSSSDNVSSKVSDLRYRQVIVSSGHTSFELNSQTQIV